MKAIKKIVLLLALSMATTLNAQQQDSKQMELVLEVPNADINLTFEKLKNKLNRLNHVRVEGFCDSQKLLYLRLDPEQYFNVLVAVNEAGFTYYIKKDVNLNKAIDTCVDKRTLYLRESSSLE